MSQKLLKQEYEWPQQREIVTTIVFFENHSISKKDVTDNKVKYQGVKEFHMLARINCYCKIMVFSPFGLGSIIVNHPMVTNEVALSNI